MTAEVAIINRHAIALAADSAVTVGHNKVWTSANKIFSLGPQNDIAIMVYGAGEFMGMDWETVVKQFRKERARLAPFETVAQCEEAFRTFLKSTISVPEIFKKKSVIRPVFDLLQDIRRFIPESNKPNDGRILIELISRKIDIIQTLDVIAEDINKSDFLNFFSSDVDHLIDNLFAIESNCRVDLKAIILRLFVTIFCRKYESWHLSGVVFAGFGLAENFPALTHFISDGMWQDKLKWWQGTGCTNLNDHNQLDSDSIVLFGQDDASFLFMTGISPEHMTFLEDTLKNLMRQVFDGLFPDKNTESTEHEELAAALSVSFMDKFFQKIREEQYQPFNDVARLMPKEEMAVLAESLVELQSLKRKMDSSAPSVGGPIDVAIISKGDGVIWIKRKHYFDPKYNQDYFARKRRLEGLNE